MLQSKRNPGASVIAPARVMPMKPCINQDTIRTTPTELFIQIAKRAGFPAIELTIDKVEPILASNSLKSLIAAIQGNGLAVASINGPENFNLISRKQFTELKERTRRLAQAARDLNCELLIPVSSPLTGNLSTEEVLSQTAESLAELADCCGDDMKLGLEFLGVSECSVRDLDSAIQIIRRVDRRNVGLVLDAFHLYLSGFDFRETESIECEDIFLVHVNDSEPGDRTVLRDSNRVFPGQGVIDLKQFGMGLARLGYDGYLSLELLRPSYWEKDPATVAKTGRESLRKVFGI
jgi:2-keto-myo-inositol isomerase